MKANELRIGNLIGWDPELDLIFTVEEIHPEWLIVKTTHKSGGSLTARIGIDSAEPVPVTEKGLVKFGFVIQKSRSNTFFVCKRFILQCTREKTWIVTDSIMGYYYATIEYEHQLQNLYFALTGEELTPNPTEK